MNDQPPILAAPFLAIVGSSGLFIAEEGNRWIGAVDFGLAAHVAALVKPDLAEITICSLSNPPFPNENPSFPVISRTQLPEFWAEMRIAKRSDLPATVVIDETGVVTVDLPGYYRPERPFATVFVGIAKPYDLNLDGRIDSEDLSLLLGGWGVYKGADLAALLGSWGDYFAD